MGDRDYESMLKPGERREVRELDGIFWDLAAEGEVGRGRRLARKLIDAIQRRLLRRVDAERE